MEKFWEINRVSSTESLDDENPDREEGRKKRIQDWQRWFWGPVDNKAGEAVDIKLPKNFPDYLLHLGAPVVQKVSCSSKLAKNLLAHWSRGYLKQNQLLK